MKTVKIKVDYEEKASRLEIFIRIIWASICVIALLVLGIFVVVAAIFQMLHILILGKRDFAAHELITNWLIAFANVGFYKNMCTDERPPLWPGIF